MSIILTKTSLVKKNEVKLHITFKFSKPLMTKRFCYGIDLGTTNSCIAAFSDEPNVILNKYTGEPTTPSVVSFKDDNVTIGKPARDLLRIGDVKTFHSIKRLIGRYYSDRIVQENLSNYNFQVEKDSKDKPLLCLKSVKYGDRKLYPEHISALVLRSLLNDAIASTDNTTMRKAVVTVPANFNDYQRRATIEAGRIAGFEVLDVLSEPAAAAICYAYSTEKRTRKETVLVFDFGCETLDVSILDIDNLKFIVRSTAGDTHCGGADIDKFIVDDMENKIREKFGIILSSTENKYYYNKLMPIAVSVKEALSVSTTNEAPIQIPEQEKYYYYVLNRATLESLSSSMIPRIENVITKALSLANLKKEEIDEIVIVGGSSKVPFVRNMIENFFGKAPHEPVDAQEAIAKGAAIYGANLCKQRDPSLEIEDIGKITVNDIIPRSIGFMTKAGPHFIIKKGTTRPITTSLMQYIGNVGSKYFDVKVCEGDEDDKEHVNIVSENRIFAEDFEENRPVIKMGLQVTQEEIKLIARTTSGTKSLRIDTTCSTHTPEEVESIKRDIELFMKNDEEEDKSAEWLNEINRKFRSINMKLKSSDPKKKEIAAMIKEYREKTRKLKSDEEFQNLKDEIERELKSRGLK